MVHPAFPFLDFIDEQFFGNTILDPGTVTGAEKNTNTSKSSTDKITTHKAEGRNEGSRPKTRPDGYKTRDSLSERKSEPRTSPAMDYVRKLRAGKQDPSHDEDGVGS